MFYIYMYYTLWMIICIHMFTFIIIHPPSSSSAFDHTRLLIDLFHNVWPTCCSGNDFLIGTEHNGGEVPGVQVNNKLLSKLRLFLDLLLALLKDISPRLTLEEKRNKSRTFDILFLTLAGHVPCISKWTAVNKIRVVLSF